MKKKAKGKMQRKKEGRREKGDSKYEWGNAFLTISLLKLLDNRHFLNCTDLKKLK